MKKVGTIVLMLALVIGGAIFFPVGKPHVQLPAEKIGELAGIPITNTMTAAWATIIVLSLLFFFATRKMQMVPGRLQCLAEAAIEVLLGLSDSIAGKEKSRMFFPLVGSFFLYIMVSNWMGLLPGYTTIGLIETIEGEHGEVEQLLLPLFRSANTDLNTTLALAIVSVVATQFYGIRALGTFSYIGRFFTLKGPMDFFVGILETVSEIAKIISFSFRLFGNVFAGEVLLGVMVFLVPWVASVPFMGLELFVGAIQAFVFMLLTLVFLTVATTGHGGEHETEHGKAH